MDVAWNGVLSCHLEMLEDERGLSYHLKFTLKMRLAVKREQFNLNFCRVSIYSKYDFRREM